MTRKIYRGVLLIFIISICFINYSKAQTTDQDSLVTNVRSIAYGKQPFWMVTSAVSSVTGNELQKSFTTNLANTLFGRLSGLTVIQGGNEDGDDSPTLHIRGLNTYGPGRSILVIVDGVQSTFERLVPDEIESVSVLKDASATAIYGSKGANGVLLVTTKKGNTGPMLVSFSTQQGFSQAQRLPKLLGSYEYAKLYNEASVNDLLPEPYSNGDLEAYRTGSEPTYHPDVNWYDEILRKSTPISNYNLNFRGGNSDVRYFVLLNAITSKGLLKETSNLSDNSINQKYSRYNFRTNIDVNLSKNLSATFLLGGSIEKKTFPGGRNSTMLFYNMAHTPSNAFPVRNPNNSFGGNPLYTNPLGDVLNTGFYSTDSRTIQVTFKMTEKLDVIAKGLSISGLVSFNNYYSGNSDKTRTYASYYLTKDTEGKPVYNQIGQETSLSSSEGLLSQWRNSTIQAFLNYTRTLGNHSFDAMMMVNNESQTFAGDPLPYKNSRIAGRFTYANQEKYIGELSFAYNGSDNFAKVNRWGLFPSVSLGWILSKEDFIKESKMLNYLKIRGSYGLTGNDQIGGQRFMFREQPYGYSDGYTFGTSNNGQSGISEGQIANPNVTWEKEKKLNLGFEATVFKHFDVVFDVFNNDRYDILSLPNRTVPQYLGFNLPYNNIGKTNNKGFEVQVGYNSDTKNDFQYFVDVNIWYAKNKIIYNAEPFQENEYLYSTGHAIDQPFSLEAIGFFKDQTDIDNSARQIFSTVRPGDIKYKDQNLDKVIDQNDFIAIGNTGMPNLSLGFETGFKYKGFDLNAFVQCVTNRTTYLDGNYYQAFQNHGNISTVALGRWTPQTASTATYPRLSSVDNLNNQQWSSFWQRDGSFIKLRSLELGYSLSDEIIKRLHMGNARVYLNGTNLFSIDKMDFTDPESSSGYPAMRTYSIGTRIQF